jgi:broad specificity phosphatase PhoE
MMPICLVRHGPTAWNREGRLQGRRDIPLDEDGRSEVAHWRLPTGFAEATVLVSPAARARETAAIMGLADARIEPRLWEMAWGAYEGRTVEDLRRDEGAAFTDLEARGLDFCAPGGETPRQVAARLQAVLRDLAMLERPCVVIAHKGLLRAAMVLATGWSMLGKPPLRLRQDRAVVGELGQDGSLSDLALVDLHRDPP